MRWLVDGMNVIGSRPDGWWRDRAGAARRLAAGLRQLAADWDEDITVALEGTVVPDLPAGEHDGLTVLYARRRGPNAADDRIVEAVAADHDPASLSVVTSDRDLARRVARPRSDRRQPVGPATTAAAHTLGPGRRGWRQLALGQAITSMGVPTGTIFRALMVSGLARTQPCDEVTPLVEPGSEG